MARTHSQEVATRSLMEVVSVASMASRISSSGRQASAIYSKSSNACLEEEKGNGDRGAMCKPRGKMLS